MSVRSYLQSRNFNLDSVVDFQTLPVTDLNGVVVTTTNFSTSIGGNGHKYEYDSTEAKANHDGYSIISPTVPWDGTAPTLAAFQAGTGETDGAGSGCWILRDTVREVSGRVQFEGPSISQPILTDAQKGVANGVASLDGSGLIPPAQIPASGQIELTSVAVPASGALEVLDVFTNFPGYRFYRAVFVGLQRQAGTTVELRVSTDGATPLSTAIYDEALLVKTAASPVIADSFATGQTAASIFDLTLSARNYGYIDFYDPTDLISASTAKTIVGELHGFTTSISSQESFVRVNTTSALTGFRIVMSGVSNDFQNNSTMYIFGSNAPF